MACVLVMLNDSDGDEDEQKKNLCWALPNQYVFIIPNIWKLTRSEL